MADQATETPVIGKNCAACKKPLKRKKRYYRNGAYYCNNNCFKKTLTKAEGEEKAEPKAEAKAEPKSEPNVEAKAEAQLESKAEAKAENNVSST